MTATAPPDVKAALRRAALERRRGQPPERRRAGSRAIARRLLGLDAWREAETVHAYVGAVDGEVETREIVLEGLARGKRILCPRVRRRPRGLESLESLEIRSLDDLEENERGLWEPDPERARAVGPDEPIDLVVVPGLAFDRAGNRLGYGAGFYDRFLATTDAVRVALAFSLQLVDAVPVEPHDQAVDWIVTEREAIACRRVGAPGERHVARRETR